MILIMSIELISLIKTYPHKTRTIEAETTLFRRDGIVRKLFIVEFGIVELVRYSENGSGLVLQRATDGQILAEASLYSKSYHCDAVITTSARLQEFSKTMLLDAIQTDPKLLHLWAAYLSRTVQEARQRAEILSRRSVTDRLDGWLAMHDMQMPEKGQWYRLAMEIGVTPEALYREIAKRR